MNDFADRAIVYRFHEALGRGTSVATAAAFAISDSPRITDYLESNPPVNSPSDYEVLAYCVNYRPRRSIFKRMGFK